MVPTHHIARAQDKNKELTTIFAAAAASQTYSSPFTMALNGVIDAAVNGGINNYKLAFFSKGAPMSFRRIAHWPSRNRRRVRRGQSGRRGAPGSHSQHTPRTTGTRSARPSECVNRDTASSPLPHRVGQQFTSNYVPTTSPASTSTYARRSNVCVPRCSTGSSAKTLSAIPTNLTRCV